MAKGVNRREFLNTAAAAAVASGVVVGARPAQAGEPPASWSEEEMPDTLDLADRARIAVSALTQVVDPRHNYQPYHQAVFYANPPYMSHQEGLPGGAWAGNELWGKHVETLVKMRIASGCDQNLDVDKKTLEGMIACIGDDNLYWKKVFIPQGDQAVPGEDHAPLLAQARVALALLDQYQWDNNPRWLNEAQRLATGLRDVAIVKEDYAYYPDADVGGTLCMPRGGWKTTAEPPAWSVHRNWHFSNSTIVFSYGAIVRLMCRLHKLTGEEKPLEFAGRLVKYMLKPQMWVPEAEPRAVVGSDHAHFDGHIHCYCWGLWGLLDYAEATNNAHLKAFARDGYEYARNFGIHRVGLFAEGCTVGDMTNLAIRLSELGVGDYWEDVDCYVRNHLVEIQLLRADLAEQVAQASPAHQARSWDDNQKTIRRNIGALFADATHLTTATPGGIYCCTQNGLIAYYHAWKSIVEPRGSAAQVNLLLNRPSPWLDIDSYLPYQGKVVIRNKTARAVSVRIPEWVDRETVKSTVNRQAAGGFWVGRYLIFDQVGQRDLIEIQFPVVETWETHRNGFEGVKMPGHTEVSSTVGKQPEKLTAYRFHLRGNTVVEISPRDEALGYPLYLRDQMKATQAPMKKRGHYLATKFI